MEDDKMNTSQVTKDSMPSQNSFMEDDKMNTSQVTKDSMPSQNSFIEDDKMNTSQVTKDSTGLTSLLAGFPREKWWEDHYLYQWEGYWHFPAQLEGAIAFQSHFKAFEDDIILASSIKVGTTWLKALLSCITTCTKTKDGSSYVVDDEAVDVLLTNNPHSLVGTLDNHIYMQSPVPDLSSLPSPRIFHTHLAYKSLPVSIKNYGCKMVYVVRNPKDTFISLWHFFNTTRTPEQGPYPMEKAFEFFCNGITPYGPFFDHVLEYWNESQKSPGRILFMKYEEVKRDPRGEVKRLCSFIGKPLANDEEVDKVLWRCSIDRLKNLEVNKKGKRPTSVLRHSSFFRLGVVGDWKNHFSPEMTQRLDEVTRSKLEGSGLDLEI